jgi:guanine nucleotide-binding protein G(i) subunit alpha
MDEALAVFRQIINNKLFAETEIILFINKIDLLAKKLNESPLKSYLPDYKGGSNSQQALEAIRHHFQKHSAKKLSYFNTCATDTVSIAQAIKVISSSILTKQLEPLTRFF